LNWDIFQQSATHCKLILQKVVIVAKKILQRVSQISLFALTLCGKINLFESLNFDKILRKQFFYRKKLSVENIGSLVFPTLLPSLRMMLADILHMLPIFGRFLCTCLFIKGTGTRDLIWLKVVSLERSW